MPELITTTILGTSIDIFGIYHERVGSTWI